MKRKKKRELNEHSLEAKSYKLKANHKHLHHVFLKKNGALEFHDIRKFGTIKLLPTAEVILQNFKLGAEPLDKNFTNPVLSCVLSRHKNKPLKNLLLDQTLVAESAIFMLLKYCLIVK